ncbi:helicase associated domain-containing protein [Flaviaesturariibacter aridisoli]|nr:helicase associated domain-containing protein [Flaviaesturariibacter aridisoli]
MQMIPANTVVEFKDRARHLADFIACRGRYPRPDEDEEICLWVSRLRQAIRYKRLAEEQLAILRRFGILVGKRPDWERRYERLCVLLAAPPARRQNEWYATIEWFRLQVQAGEKGRLPQESLDRLLELAPKVDLFLAGWQKMQAAAKMNWDEKIAGLLAFRALYPNRWPNVREPIPAHRKTGNWCMEVRRQYAQGVLPASVEKKLRAVGFDPGGHAGRWQRHCDELAGYLKKNRCLPFGNATLFKWLCRQMACFDQLGRLRKQQLTRTGCVAAYRRWRQASDPNLRWEQDCKALAAFMKTHGRLPRPVDGHLHQWMLRQRAALRRQRLPPGRLQKLGALPLNLFEADSARDRWEKQFASLCTFRAANPGRWPASDKRRPEERSLAIWCQSQRQAYRGTLKNQKPLDPEKIAKLEAAGFSWRPSEQWDAKWEQRLEELKSCRDPKTGKFAFPKKMDGKTNPLYQWYAGQLQAARKSALSVQREEALRQLGVL